MEMITPGWFISHILIGIVIGYALRVFEYVVWRGMQDEAVEPGFGFAIMLIPPCLIVGATLSYISVVLLFPVIKDNTAISLTVLVYLLSAFWSFLSLDVRSFLRRH
jgi:hypothetical protein